MAKLKLSRDQLATFLKDPEQIKQFEKLFSTVDQSSAITLPDIFSIIEGAKAQTETTSALVQSLREGIESSSAAVYARIEQLASKLTELDSLIAADNSEARYSEVLGLLQAIKYEINGIRSQAIVQDPPKRVRVGNFYDTTTQTAAAINTAYALTFNTTDLSDGVYIGSPTSRVYVDTEAIYNLQFSIQLDNTSGGNHLAFLWYRINGVDVANSASQVRLKGTDGELVAAWNFVTRLKGGDYAELMYSVSDTAVQVVAQAAAAPVPAIPSVILSVTTV